MSILGKGRVMRGEQYLTKSQQYAFVYHKGQAWASAPVVMKAVNNGLPLSRYGFSVSKKVGNAVVRNRVKRRFREILRSMRLKSGQDIIFIARPAVATTDYWKLKKTVEGLLRRAHLLEIAGEHGYLAELKLRGE